MKRWRRSVVAALWAALLAAPTPGAVGSCGTDEGGRAVLDVGAYCVEREDYVCVRRRERGELSIGGLDECRVEAREVCARRWWAPECRPTERQARACLNALASRATLSTPEDELDECRADALCRARIRPPDAAATGGAGESGGSP